jgi:hypothetical protein
MALPKLTDQQLLDRCDLAGIARVVSVGRATPNSPVVAKLVFLRVVKGVPRERSGFVHVRLKGGVPPHLDDGLVAWSDGRDYRIGAAVMTHLDWSGPDEHYLTTWPGAVAEVAVEKTKVA